MELGALRGGRQCFNPPGPLNLIINAGPIAICSQFPCCSKLRLCDARPKSPVVSLAAGSPTDVSQPMGRAETHGRASLWATSCPRPWGRGWRRARPAPFGVAPSSSSPSSWRTSGLLPAGLVRRGGLTGLFRRWRGRKSVVRLVNRASAPRRQVRRPEK